MGEFYKEGRHWYFIIKLPFWWIEHFSPGTCWLMLEKSSHCDVIITYDYINYKAAVVECIFFHLQNYISLYTFRSPLRFFFALVLLCLFSSIICSITLLVCLWIDKHTYNTLVDTENYVVITNRGFISTDRISLLSPHIICSDEFYLVYVFPSSERAHHCTYNIFFCANVGFIYIWIYSSTVNSIAICSSMPASDSIFVKFCVKSLPRKI